MKTHIVALYHENEEQKCLSMLIDIDRPNTDIRQAFQDALTDFLDNGGLKAVTAMSSVGSRNFNWKDAALWLPDEYAKRHGFTILDATDAPVIVSCDEILSE